MPGNYACGPTLYPYHSRLFELNIPALHDVRNTLAVVRGMLNCDEEVEAVGEVRLNGVSIGRHGAQGSCECGTCAETAPMVRWGNGGIVHRNRNSLSYHLLEGQLMCVQQVEVHVCYEHGARSLLPMRARLSR